MNKELEHKLPSDFLTNQFVEDTAHLFFKARQEYLLKNLEYLGFKFASHEEIEAFFKNRVTKVSFEENPNYHEFHLDFGLESSQIIGSYYDNIYTVMDGQTMKIIIGK